jgi:NAD(P)-dependent dehydrogenase (short-subunit alcohol dehydrogenase family)
MVEAFVAQGSNVAFVDIAKDESLRVVERAAGPVKPLFIECDLTDLAALEAAMVETRQRLGPVAVLVNNASNDTRRAFSDVTEADWDFTMAVNLKHQFFAAQIAARSMREIGGGSIVNFSSVVWVGGVPRLAVYSAAKAAVIGLTNSLARELGGDNVRVNCIAPGAVMTERQRRLWFTTEADVAAMVARQCLPRPIDAEAVASAALFLAADDSRMITKHCLVVDAGMR